MFEVPSLVVLTPAQPAEHTQVSRWEEARPGVAKVGTGVSPVTRQTQPLRSSRARCYRKKVRAGVGAGSEQWAGTTQGDASGAELFRKIWKSRVTGRVVTLCKVWSTPQEVWRGRERDKDLRVNKQ